MPSRLKANERGNEVSIPEFCRFNGYAERIVYGWIKDGAPVRKVPSKRGVGYEYRTNPRDLIAWRQAKSAPSVEDMDMETAKRRKAAADAGIAELELAKFRVDVVETKLISKLIADNNSRVRTRLLAGPASISPRVVFLADVQAGKLVIESWVDECLRDLSEFRPDVCGVGIPGEPDRVPPETSPDHQPVGGPVPQAKPRGKRRARTVVDGEG